MLLYLEIINARNSEALAQLFVYLSGLLLNRSGTSLPTGPRREFLDGDAIAEDLRGITLASRYEIHWHGNSLR